MATDGQVYLGTWTNWSRGSATMGATLTMTQEHGNLLIAFTALFVPFVASRFWSICAIVFHQCCSTSDLRDAIHHQRQVVLRNSSSPESGLMSFVQLGWAWRRSGQQSRRILPLVLFISCFIGTFTVAGGFSSRLSTTGEVLLKGDDCEVPHPQSYVNFTVENMAKSDTAIFTNNVASYAQQCYSNDTSNFLDCSRFVTSTLPTAVEDRNAPCPFSPELCRRNDSGIRLDTGWYLKSFFTLPQAMDSGLILLHPYPYCLIFPSTLTNTPTRCSPLVTEGRAHDITTSGHNFTTYYYGPLRTPPTREPSNHTIAVPVLDTQYAMKHLPDINDYDFLLSPKQFRTFQGALLNSSSQFNPDPALIHHDGDVTLVFLSGNGVNFLSPTDDDWYRATVRSGAISSADKDRKNATQFTYRPEEAASVLGCVQQFQWCRDPTKGQCGKLQGRLDALYSAAPLFDWTGEDMDAERPIPRTKLGSLLIWAYFILVEDTTNLQGVLTALGPSSLASHTLVTQGQISSLPRQQWQLDVKRWWEILLAGFQARFINTAQGAAILPNRPYTIKPSSDYEWEFCRNQKIRSARYASFSVFGLAFTYSVGALIIVISFLVEPILCYLQKRGGYNKYAYLEWEGNTAVQLHRLAQDELGNGHWSHCDETNPITRTNDLMAPFDISDPSHPMLARKLDGKAPGDTRPENAGHGLSGEETTQESSLENGNGGVPLRSSAGVRRAFSDAHATALEGEFSKSVDGKLEKHQSRPGSAP